MTQVRLLPGSVYHDAQEWNRGYMARLAADRLLYTLPRECRSAGRIGQAAGRMGAAGERHSGRANCAAISWATFFPRARNWPRMATTKLRPKPTTSSQNWPSASRSWAANT